MRFEYEISKVLSLAIYLVKFLLILSTELNTGPGRYVDRSIICILTKHDNEFISDMFMGGTVRFVRFVRFYLLYRPPSGV